MCLIFSSIANFCFEAKVSKTEGCRILAKKGFIDGSGQQLALLRPLSGAKRAAVQYFPNNN